MAHEVKRRCPEFPVYRATIDARCNRESAVSMKATLEFLQSCEKLQVAYLQGCEGMTTQQNFTSLLHLLRTHTCLWALNMGELSSSLDGEMMEQLLKALSDSNIVAFYYDTNPSFVEFKKAVKAAIYANRSKHSMWDCYGDGDPNIIRTCNGMYFHPKDMARNANFFSNGISPPPSPIVSHAISSAAEEYELITEVSVEIEDILFDFTLEGRRPQLPF